MEFFQISLWFLNKAFDSLNKASLNRVSFICPMAHLFHLAPGKQHRIIKTCVFHGEQSYPIITITPAEQYKNMTVKGQIHCSIWILDCYLNFQPLSKKALFYFSLDSHDMDTRAGTYSLWEIRLISHLFTICPPSHNWKTCYSLLYSLF